MIYKIKNVLNLILINLNLKEKELLKFRQQQMLFLVIKRLIKAIQFLKLNKKYSKESNIFLQVIRFKMLMMNG